MSKSKVDKVRKTLYIERETVKRLKILSAEKETSESDLVNRLIEQAWGSEQQSKPCDLLEKKEN